MKPTLKLPLNRMLGLLLLITLSPVLHADSIGEGAAKADTKPDARTDAKSDNKSEAKIFEEPPPSITAHSLTIGGNTLKYHATAGYIVLKEEEGKPLVRRHQLPCARSAVSRSTIQSR